METYSTTRNWVFFVIAVVLASGSIFYFINKTNMENDALNQASATFISLQNQTTKTDKKPNAPTSGDSRATGAILVTNYGEIEIVFRNKAPLAVSNFTKLAQSGFYDGTRFHRVIPDFMIQGGDPLSKDISQKNIWGTGGPGYQFADEFYSDDTMNQGVMALANSGPNTNGSQFFIVTAKGGAPWLSGRHTIFGTVTRGLDVVLKIEKVKTEGKGVYDRPLQDVLIEKVILK